MSRSDGQQGRDEPDEVPPREELLSRALAIWDHRVKCNWVLPATLDLQDGLSGAGDGDVLERAALELDGDAGGRGRNPRPQGRMNGPGLLHGLRECLARPAGGGESSRGGEVQ